MSFEVGHWYKIDDVDGYVSFGGIVNNHILTKIGTATFVVTKLDAIGAVSEIKDPIDGNVITPPKCGSEILVWFTPGEYRFVEDCTPESIVEIKTEPDQVEQKHQIEIPGIITISFANATKMCDDLNRALYVAQTFASMTPTDPISFEGIIALHEGDKFRIKTDAELLTFIRWVKAIKIAKDATVHVESMLM